MKRLDTRVSPATHARGRPNCPIESHLALRGAASSSRVGPSADASSAKKRNGRLSSNQRGFLAALGSSSSRSGKGGTSRNNTRNLPPRSPLKKRAPVPEFTSTSMAAGSVDQQAKQPPSGISGSERIFGDDGSVDQALSMSAGVMSARGSQHQHIPAAMRVPEALPDNRASPRAGPTGHDTGKRDVSDNSVSPSQRSGSKWTRAEDQHLQYLVGSLGTDKWEIVSERMSEVTSSRAKHTLPLRTPIQCMNRWNRVVSKGLSQGPWSEEEDKIVINIVSKFGVGKVKWTKVAECLPGRVGKQCRERWFNHLDPSVKKGKWSQEEDDIIFEMQKNIGNKWSEIAKFVPGRTENAVKNRWNSTARKRWYSTRGEKDPGTPRSNLETAEQDLKGNQSLSSEDVILSHTPPARPSAAPETSKPMENTAASIPAKGIASAASTESATPHARLDTSPISHSATASSVSRQKEDQSSMFKPTQQRVPIAPATARMPTSKGGQGNLFSGPSGKAFAALMAKQAAIFHASIAAAAKKASKDSASASGSKKTVKKSSPPAPFVPPPLPFMPPLLMQQIMAGNLPKNAELNPQMAKLMQMQMQLMRQMQMQHKSGKKDKTEKKGKMLNVPPPKVPFVPMMPGSTFTSKKQQGRPKSKSKPKTRAKNKPKAASRPKQNKGVKGASTRSNKNGNVTQAENVSSIPSPLSTPDAQSLAFDVFGGNSLSAEELNSLLSPNGGSIADVFGGSGHNLGFDTDRDNYGGLRRKNSNRSDSMPGELPHTNSGELSLSSGGFIDDIDQILAYDDHMNQGSSVGPLAETLDKVNLDDGIAQFDLSNPQPRGKDVAKSASASGPAKRKGHRRPKLEQMPPDTFAMQSMEPVMSPFAWSNNPDAPNSITPRDMLGDPKNSFGDLLTPNGTNLNLFSPSGMDFAEDYEDL